MRGSCSAWSRKPLRTARSARSSAALVDANRADRVLTRSEWLAGLDRVSHDPSLSADIARLLNSGAPDPAALIASLFTRAGVRYSLTEDGRPRLL